MRRKTQAAAAARVHAENARRPARGQVFSLSRSAAGGASVALRMRRRAIPCHGCRVGYPVDHRPRGHIL